MFALNPRLAADTLPLGDLPLCRVLLMNDSQYPWLILVPRQAGLREVHELSPDDQAALMHESSWVASHLCRAVNADKMNVANLGNVVDQLHWHVIARFRGDAAWPAPVWGRQPAQAYTADELKATMALLRRALAGDDQLSLHWLS